MVEFKCDFICVLQNVYIPQWLAHTIKVSAQLVYKHGLASIIKYTSRLVSVLVGLHIYGMLTGAR